MRARQSALTQSRFRHNIIKIPHLVAPFVLIWPRWTSWLKPRSADVQPSMSEPSSQANVEVQDLPVLTPLRKHIAYSYSQLLSFCPNAIPLLRVDSIKSLL